MKIWEGLDCSEDEIITKKAKVIQVKGKKSSSADIEQLRKDQVGRMGIIKAGKYKIGGRGGEW